MASPVNPYFSVIIPVYGCKTSLVELYIRLKQTLIRFTESFEIIMVNDASPDNAWETIEELAEKDNRIKGINLSRNFGQHYAITAGLDYSKGEWIVVMDCDLQDNPEEIQNLYQKALQGYDYVLAKRNIRMDSFVKKLRSRIFYKLLEYLTDSKIDYTIANFGIYSRNLIDAINQMREDIRWFPTLVNWAGFNGSSLTVVHSERLDGKSSYSFNKLLNLAANVIILNSNKPLKLIVKFGFLISFISIIYGIITLYRFWNGYITYTGWTSLILSIWFLSGCIITIIGIIGLYISKIFDSSKQRPLYIIKNKTFKNE